ncbi:MAG: YceD family protein, partial [Candidatus Neomarinimicrobiota bacterium]|nr:YceD family protein [Candidatus Neomarinimicrobiota bacterium]
FEIDIKNVDGFDITLVDNKLICNLTSKIVKNGFEISGHIINTILYDCDRCLESFCNKNIINTNLLLSNDSGKLDNQNYETIYFSDHKDSVDLTKILLEILIIEIPFKKLCTNPCKGLCPVCGINLNYKLCSCSN